MEGNDEPNKNICSLKSRQRSSDHPYNAGIIWERLSIGYRIVDLEKDRFDEALDFAKNQFFTSEPMCRATFITKDKTSVRSYLDLITAWIEETRSVCAIHEGTGKLVGIAVATLNRRADHLEGSKPIHTQTNQGESISRILTLKSCVLGIADPQEKWEINEDLHLHVLCVDSDLRNRGIGTALVRSCVDYHRGLDLPACIGEFSSGAAQTIAKRLGFETLAKIPYREYVHEEKKEKPFVDAGPGNYSIACMGLRIVLHATLSRSTSATTATTSPSENKKNKKSKKKINENQTS